MRDFVLCSEVPFSAHFFGGILGESVLSLVVIFIFVFLNRERERASSYCLYLVCMLLNSMNTISKCVDGRMEVTKR